MTRLLSLLATVVCFLAGQLIAADNPPLRSATIVDTTGTETTVSGLEFHDLGMAIFEDGTGCIAISTNAMATALAIKIPLDSLISIQADGELAEAKYVFGGKETTIKGKWACTGTLSGKSDFGDFTLGVQKLKKLSFSAAPTPATGETKPRLDATLLLKDGTTVPVGNLERHSYQLINRTNYSLHFDDFRFLRGESNVTLKFTALQTIQFGTDDEVTVTLTNGAKANGKIARVDIDDCVGFTGVCTDGGFYVSRANLSAVGFGSAAPTTLATATPPASPATVTTAPTAPAAPVAPSVAPKAPAMPTQPATAATTLTAPASPMPLTADSTMLFSDDFSTFDPAWGPANDQSNVVGGRMVLKPIVNSGYTNLYGGNNFGDADIRVNVTQVTGLADQAGGIVFWAADQDNKYVAELESDGTFGITRYQADKWIYPVLGSNSAAVKKGLNQANELRVVTRGRSATVYINGTQVSTFNGYPPAGGSQVGVYAESGAQPYTWQFANFVVRQPDPTQFPVMPPSAAADPAILFADAFSTFDPAWGVADDQHNVTGSKMVIKPAANTGYSVLYQGGYFGDVDVSMKITQIEGALSDSPAGITFWAADTANSYIADIRGDGSFGVSRREAGKQLTPLPLSAQAAVKKGLNQVNELRVVTKGRSATVYVNGTQVAALKGFPPSGGSAVGLYAESGTTVYTWQISDFVVRTPQ